MVLTTHFEAILPPENKQDSKTSIMNEDVFPMEHTVFPMLFVRFQGFSHLMNKKVDHQLKAGGKLYPLENEQMSPEN